MANKELETINQSGQLTGINLGGTAPENKVLTQYEIDAKITTVDDKITLKTYDYDSESNVVITATAYEEIARLQTVSRSAGTYEIKFSFTFTYDSANKQAHFQWSIDGGAVWEEFRLEPKDVTDLVAMTYEFPINHAGGAFDIQLQGKCDTGGDTLTVTHGNIIVERKV